jgi:phosphate-selective porin OprO/OprP
MKRSSAGDLEFDSWHVSAAWALGGESRAENYALQQGEFKRLEPAADFSLGGGGGTWELSARYAALNLDDGNTLGGRESTFTVGANWYANFNFRLMLDWTRVVDMDATNASLRAAEGMNILTVRAQYAF